MSNEKLCKHKWDEQKKNLFLTDFRNIFSDLKSRLLITIGRNIDEALDLVIHMYHTAAECMRIKKSNRNKIKNEPWWDIECQNLKRLKQYYLRLFRNNNTQV